MALVGDAALTLGQLRDILLDRTGGIRRGRRAEVEARIREQDEPWWDEWLPLLTSDQAPLSPYRVIWELLHTVDVADTIMALSRERFQTADISGNYAGLAGALGLFAERVTEPGQVKEALIRGIDATRSGRPALLEFITTQEKAYSIFSPDSYQRSRSAGLGTSVSPRP